jgi:hypothetical protein
VHTLGDEIENGGWGQIIWVSFAVFAGLCVEKSFVVSEMTNPHTELAEVPWHRSGVLGLCILT